MYLRALLVLLVACSIPLLTVRGALGACCELRKIDADPPTMQVRVCDPATTPACASWLYDGTIAAGESELICTSGDLAWYEEWDETAGIWGPLTKARCEDGGAVEL